MDDTMNGGTPKTTAEIEHLQKNKTNDPSCQEKENDNF